MKWLAFLLLMSCLVVRAQAAELIVPQIDGPWWSVAGNPDLGELTSPKQQPVDFGIWQAADGTWQIWSCIRKTKEPGKTRLFHGWEGKNLTDTDWQPQGIAMRADPTLGETAGGMQAPHVVRIDGKYHMFYGDWQNLCLATSEDGKTFERQPVYGISGRFGEGPQANARDAMLISIDGLWHCYYTAHPDRVGRVLCRTSQDFKDWSEPTLVRIGGAAGDNFWSHECPHVVKYGDWYYLFTTQSYLGNPRTSVYRSQNPLNFGKDDDSFLVTTLPVAAPEIVIHEGKYYIAALKPQLDGIRIARLKWGKPGNQEE